MSVLVDTSVWVDHLRRPDQGLDQLLRDGDVLVHPFVVGELAMGHIGPREATLRLLNLLPVCIVANHHETAALIENKRLYGSGIGYIDAHLLASVQLTRRSRLWTRDARLEAVARQLAVPIHDATAKP